MQSSSPNVQVTPDTTPTGDVPKNYAQTRAVRRKMYFRAAWTGAVYRVINIVVQIVSLAMTVRYLGGERYGVWMTISTIAAWLALANLGLGQGLTTRLSSLGVGAERREEAQRSICSTIAVSSCIMLVLLPAGLLVASMVPWARVFKLNSALAIVEVGPTVLISVAAIVLTLPIATAGSILAGYQRMELVNLTVIISSLIGLAFLIVAMKLHWGLPALAVAVLLPQMGASAAQFLVVRRLGYLSFELRHVDFGEAWKMLRLGSKFLITQLFGIFIFETGALIIASKLGASEVTPYGIVNRMVMVIVTVFTVIMSPLWPAYGDAFGRGDTEWARRVFYKSVRLVLGLWLLAAVILAIAGRWIILIWAGPAAVPSWLLLWTMLAYALSFGAGLVVAQPLNGSGRMGSQIAAAVICGLLNIPISMFLADKFGAVGVVISQTSLMFLVAVPIQLTAVLRLIRPVHPVDARAKPEPC